MATGKAAVLDRPMGTFHLEEFRVPDPAPGTVLLRQELAGCCATDAHTYLGQWPADFPVILGHENVGIVEAIGSGGALDFLGREVRVGDRVIDRTGCCGTCYECRVAHQPRRPQPGAFCLLSVTTTSRILALTFLHPSANQGLSDAPRFGEFSILVALVVSPGRRQHG